MCGIVGYIGNRDASSVLIKGLKRLEYRGYDSAGIAVCGNGCLENPQEPPLRINIRKTAGRVDRLEEVLRDHPLERSPLGIGHTRWATHGRPSDINAHPHFDRGQGFVVVHNGIIENFTQLRRWLSEQGYDFETETDTEVVPHLISYFYKGDLVAAVRQAVSLLRGAYALAIMSRWESDKLVAVKQASPLIIGLGEGENFLASDIPAVLEYTRRFLVLEEGEMAVIDRKGVTVTDLSGNPREKQVWNVDWDAEQAEKGGFDHFMLKEIHDQPRAILNTMRGRVDWDAGRVVLNEVGLDAGQLREIDKVYLVACGTAYHAGLVGGYLIDHWARLPAVADVASEFRYRDPLVDERTLVLVISQSGETADTLAALREAKERGARVVAVTNVVGSSIAREAHDVLYTWAGPEIAVASTKAYITQLVTLVLFALFLAQARRGMAGGVITEKQVKAVLDGLKGLAGNVENLLAQAERMRTLGEEISRSESAFYIGRGLDYAVAMEGQLKLKEISYIHAEAYAAGELKHGTLALIEEGVPVITLATQPGLYEKTISNAIEVKARGGRVIMVTPRPEGDLLDAADQVIPLPEIHPFLAPILAVVPLQLLAYYAAVARGADVDKPRNLAKSVTVE